MASELLPIFPLPNVVLFPNVFLPLHIFEPRYREMTASALESDRMIGMVLLRPGWQRDYEGRPPVYQIGCSGVITHAERQSDGRYNLVLRGVERFRIVEEDHDRSYRRAVIDPLRERPLGDDERTEVRRLRARLETLVTTMVEKSRSETKIPSASAIPDEDLVNALAQYFDLEPLEKQALLEQPCLRSRAESLVELLEMKLLMLRSGCGSHVAH